MEEPLGKLALGGHVQIFCSSRVSLMGTNPEVGADAGRACWDIPGVILVIPGKVRISVPDV